MVKQPLPSLKQSALMSYLFLPDKHREGKPFRVSAAGAQHVSANPMRILELPVSWTLDRPQTEFTARNMINMIDAAILSR